MNLFEKTLTEEYLYNGKIINLRRDEIELPDGNHAFREVVEHPGGVCVLPLTDENEVIFVRQFRYPYKEILLEIPAGKRDHVGEDPLECGKRELKDETGAVAENRTFFCELYPCPGYVGEVIYIYLARTLSYGDAEPDEDEFLDVVKLPFEKALEMVLSGEIKDAKTQSAILKTALMKERN